jgi:HemY protein
MVRFLLVCIILALSVGSTYWVKQNSGDLSFTFLEYNVQTSVTEFFVIFLVGLITLQFIIFGVYRLLLIPKRIQAFITEKKKNQLLEDATAVVQDIFTKSIDKLEARYRNLKKHLFPEAEAVLLYFIEKTKGNLTGIKNKLILLTKNSKTAPAAYEELISLAIQQKDWFLAASHCAELWKIDKSQRVAYLCTQCFVNAKRWRELDEMISSGSKLSSLLGQNIKRRLGGKDAKVIQGICKYKIAEELFELTELDNARKYALQAVNLLEGFVPATKIALKCVAPTESLFLKLIKKQWKAEPHHFITDMIYTFSERTLDEKFYKMLRDIASANSSAYESHLLLGNIALEADQFEIASKHLANALEGGKKTRACLLMAEFCLRTHANKSEVIEWLRHAQRAQDDRKTRRFFWNLEKEAWVNNETQNSVYIDSF